MFEVFSCLTVTKTILQQNEKLGNIQYFNSIIHANIQKRVTSLNLSFHNLSCLCFPSPSNYPRISQQASNTLVVMSRFPIFFVFSRPGFMRPRLPVRWTLLGPPNTLSFSRRMCRSVVVDLSFFSTETLSCCCQNRPVPCQAPGWCQALSRGCTLLPGCPCMSGDMTRLVGLAG